MRCETNLAVAPGAVFDLTPRQRQIYDYARDCVAVRGFGPSLGDIAAHLKVRSLAAVRRHVRRLERRGYVRYVAFTARAVQLVPGLGTNVRAVAVVPRRPSVRSQDGRVVVDIGLGTVALGRYEAVRLARQLLIHARNPERSRCSGGYEGRPPRCTPRTTRGAD